MTKVFFAQAAAHILRMRLQKNKIKISVKSYADGVRTRDVLITNTAHLSSGPRFYVDHM